MVVADGRSKEDISRRGDGSSGSTPQDSAEAKRLEARRRFLLGGATAAPILVTVNRAKAIGFSVCQSLRGKGGHGNPAPGSPTDFGGPSECEPGPASTTSDPIDSDPLALDPDEPVK